MTASDGASLCPVVTSSIGADGAAFAAEHRSRRLTADLVTGASLVLTATKAERSAVAKLHPAARAHTFTLREAAMLADIRVDGRAGAETSSPSTDLLERLAATLNARRGLGPVEGRPAPTGLRRLLPTRDAGDPLDVADGHNLGSRRHARTIAEVTRAVDRIVDALRTVSV